MNDREPHMHFVCTPDEAGELVKNHHEYWVCNCGCREERGRCARSRMDVCLTFFEGGTVTGSGRRQITAGEVAAILHEAKEKYLVARPFRDEETHTTVQGICFCCDDCCGYFLNPEEVCEKGRYIERTDMDGCTHCGDCRPVCYFKARTMHDDRLAVDSENCYGCGLCAAICPTDCIQMVERG
ncbi:MAG: 4Fe-4S binding protein [Candidatus Zixiibacteriota bacterium]|nr:MAG: 4Fe-4S binding protein [candidate division Zixibacteria bacterium]